MEMRCENCIYVFADVDDSNKGVLECRYNAPQMLSGAGAGWSDQLWPYVEPTQWCGQWAGYAPESEEEE